MDKLGISVAVAMYAAGFALIFFGPIVLGPLAGILLIVGGFAVLAVSAR